MKSSSPSPYQIQLEDYEDPTVVYPVRFDLDLFYVAPFYHKLFPNIDKMIVLDLDLEFRLILTGVMIGDSGETFSPVTDEIVVIQPPSIGMTIGMTIGMPTTNLKEFRAGIGKLADLFSFMAPNQVSCC